jgi:hypothetical protein
MGKRAKGQEVYARFYGFLFFFSFCWFKGLRKKKLREDFNSKKILCLTL